MKFIKILLITLVSVAIVAGVAGLFLPDSAHVERSVSINAPPSKVFPLLNNMRRFNEWSPWAGLDEEAVYQYSGPDSGAGAAMSWSSEDPSLGNGSMKITASSPQRIDTYLDFGDQGDANAYYIITESGAGTTVVWGFDTEFRGNIIQRYFGLVMDSLVGGSYEEGLNKLKLVAEA